MAAPKKPGFALHLHVDPYIRVKHEDHSQSYQEDARLDKFLKWFHTIPAGERTQMCLELIVAAVNGELGVAQTVMIGDDDVERSQADLKSLLANMVMDEE